MRMRRVFMLGRGRQSARARPHLPSLVRLFRVSSDSTVFPPCLLRLYRVTVRVYLSDFTVSTVSPPCLLRLYRVSSVYPPCVDYHTRFETDNRVNLRTEAIIPRYLVAASSVSNYRICVTVP